jgi:Gly-Xaa carboxypeptidase
MSEKSQPLLPSSVPAPPPAYPAQQRKRSKLPLILLGVLALLAIPHLPRLHHTCSEHLGGAGAGWDTAKYDAAYMDEFVSCPAQPKALHPKLTWEMNAEEKKKSTELFSQSVQIPTESFDDNGEPLEDARWGPFFDFQKWIAKSFPLAHEKATVEYVNTLGIVATFHGSDPSLKPLLL